MTILEWIGFIFQKFCLRNLDPVMIMLTQLIISWLGKDFLFAKYRRIGMESYSYKRLSWKLVRNF